MSPPRLRRLCLVLIARHARKEIPMLYVAGIAVGLFILGIDMCARACQRFRDQVSG